MTHKNTTQTVTIGIPAYNAQGNIRALVESLIGQVTPHSRIIEIIVYSDGSIDKTVQQAKSLLDKRLVVIDAHIRQGMVHGLKTMLKRARGDVFILLNDDIMIDSKTLIADLIQPLTRDSRVGLVSGNPQPMSPTTFVEAAGISTFRAYERMRYSVRNGNNKHTCDGKLLALSGTFIKTLQYPEHDADMANVDGYLYLSCLTNGFVYKHVQKAKVYFRFPTTIADYVRWNSRNNSCKYILSKTFGDLVAQEWQKPTWAYREAVLRQCITHPFACLLAGCLGFVYAHNAKTKHQYATPVWESVRSTKL